MHTAVFSFIDLMHTAAFSFIDHLMHSSTASMVSNSLDSICYSVGLPGFNPSEAREWKVDNGKEWVDSSVRAVAYPVFRALRL